MTYSTYRDLPTYPVTYDNLLHVYIIYFLIKYFANIIIFIFKKISQKAYFL